MMCLMYEPCLLSTLWICCSSILSTLFHKKYYQQKLFSRSKRPRKKRCLLQAAPDLTDLNHFAGNSIRDFHFISHTPDCHSLIAD